jgi:hypothetical protein
MSEQTEQTPGATSPAETGIEGASPSASEAQGSEAEGAGVQQESAEMAEHKERSMLGRRFTKAEQEIAGLKEQLNRMTERLLNSNAPSAMNQAVSEQPPVDYITTPEDLERYEAWKEAKLERQRNQYANQYVHSIKTMNYINPEMHSEIEAELLTNVNDYPTYSKFADPVSDARANYYKAESKVLKQKLTGNQVPPPNVRGGANAPTGLSGTSRVNTPAKPTVKLDEFASKFLKSLGESEDAEWVQKSVARDK